MGEFKAGQDYYFISTSTKRDLHRRVGGYCSTHNMRMVFRVAQRVVDQDSNVVQVQVNHPRKVETQQLQQQHQSQEYGAPGCRRTGRTTSITTNLGTDKSKSSDKRDF